MGVQRMLRFSRVWLTGLVALIVTTACASPVAVERNERAATGVAPAGSSLEGRMSTGPKRFNVAIRGNPHTLYQKLNPRSNIPGIDGLERMVGTGLTVASPDGGRTARLAETVPTLENGLWKLLPDSTMEMTWTLKPNIVWHDGTPMTSDDLVFTAQVVRDREYPVFRHVAFDSLGTVEAIDQRTVVVRWTKPFINADQFFSSEIALPIAKHRLEEAYRTDREHFLDHPYWSTEYVGVGPFKLKSWEAGSHLVAEANDRYVMGRPRIDEIVVKFIPDPNTLAANLLAGEVDMVWGGRIDIEWGKEVGERWRDGKLGTAVASMLQIFVQHLNPSPSVLGNVEFKRAMVHALDRQAMVETLQFGLTSIGHTFVAPNQPEHAAIESAVVKYDYDQRRSLQMLEGLGYTRGNDGALRDRAGERLAFQIRTSQGDVSQEKAMYASADDWQRLGVEVDRHLVPPQRANDAEYRSTFPAFDLKRQGGDMEFARSFLSSRIALPENNFQVSGNNSRYAKPEMDRQIDRYFTTIPMEERMQAARQIVRMVAEDVAWIGLYYQVSPILLPNKVPGLQVSASPGTWGEQMVEFLHEWDIR
jgi:peptide/nickel transport system substrate-binding protein